MANEIISSKEAFLEAVQNFPRWMSVRKRPEKSNLGKLLQAIFHEHTGYQDEMDSFISDFFLLSYVGREKEIADYVYISQVGNVFGDLIDLKNPVLTVTEDPKLFLANKSYSLYQGGYLFIHLEKVPEDKKCIYAYNGHTYGGTWEKYHIWNVFDEFADFLSLERFDGETNTELLKRCFLVFKNPANSTAKGLKHAIMNAVVNDVPIEEDDIKIEPINADNLEYSDDAGTFYEQLANFNHDVFRTKQWDMHTWEQNFKTLDFIPHVWDKEISVYRDGTGQNNDLKVQLSNSVKDDKTNVTITGYKKSIARINEYTHRHNLHQEIPLALKRYKEELKPMKVEYKIKAAPAIEIENPTKIYLKEEAVVEGESHYYLEDIVTDPDAITVIPHNVIEPGSTYSAKFFPRSDYDAMEIEKAELTLSDGTTKNLLVPKGRFQYRNGLFQDIDVYRHISKVAQLKDYRNVEEYPSGGFRIGKDASDADLYVDVSGCSNKALSISVTGNNQSITNNSGFFTLNGFTDEGNGIFEDNSKDSDGYMEVDLDCTSFEFKMFPSEDQQGTASVEIQVDGKAQKESGLWNSEKAYSADFGKMSHVHVTIRKLGMYGVSFGGFRAARYSYDYDINEGQITKSPFGGLILPSMLDGKKYTLHIHMSTYDAEPPVLNYIHVGSATKGASYVIDNIKTDNDGATIDLSSTCRIELWKGKECLYTDYSPKATYKNETDETNYLIINTDRFAEITRSSRPISNITDNSGNSVKAIAMLPGEELDSIDITGVSYQTTAHHSLKQLLSMRNSQKLYVSGEMPGFILKDVNTKEEVITVLPREKLTGGSIFTYENVPEGLSGCFRVDSSRNILTKANKTERMFEDTYLVSDQYTEYVAYNNTTALDAVIDNVQIVNTFQPILDMKQLMLYQIIVGDEDKGKVSVQFIKGTGESDYRTWSLGIKSEGLHISIANSFSNIENYSVEVGAINEYFAISNEIPLEKAYSQDKKFFELAKYIVTPPDYLSVKYKSETVMEDIYVLRSGFNKLSYSNVTDILQVVSTDTGNTLPASAYTLLGKEGILIWKDSSYADAGVTVVYSYNVPTSLAFKDLDYLYDLVGYDVKAYSVINHTPIQIRGLKDGGARDVVFHSEEDNSRTTPDKVILHCSNPNFSAKYANGRVTVKRTNDNAAILVNTGYYYDDGKEYYLFNHDHQEPVEKLGNVTLNNVRRIGTDFEMMQNSVNHLRNSDMIGDKPYTACDADFLNKDFQAHGISQYESLTACESYNGWNAMNMDVSFVSAFNDLGIRFVPELDPAYAILDVTKFVKNGKILTFTATDSLSVKLMKEVKADGDSMAKTIFAEPYRSFQKEDICYYLHFEDIDESYRYFLLVTGTGTIDDIIAKDYVEGESIKDLHKKNIDALGFNIDEKVVKGLTRSLAFDANGAILDRVEVRKDGLLRTSPTLDWGVTRVFSSEGNEALFYLKNVELQNGSFYTGKEKTGQIRSQLIYIPSHKAILDYYIKINDAVIDRMDRFNITVKAAKEETDILQEVGYRQKSNLMHLDGSAGNTYLQIVVDMPINKVINNIEIFVRYGQNQNVPVRSSINQNGVYTSKVYDAVEKGSYQLQKVTGTISDLSKASVYMRGCRQQNDREAWTEWYPAKLNESLKTDPDLMHTFKDYRLFQFRIDVNDPHEEIQIKDFVLEVV